MYNEYHDEFESLEEEVHEESSGVSLLLLGILTGLTILIIREMRNIKPVYENLNDQVEYGDLQYLYSLGYDGKGKVTLDDYITFIVKHHVYSKFNEIDSTLNKSYEKVIKDTIDTVTKSIPIQTVIPLKHPDSINDETFIDYIINEKWSGLNSKEILDRYKSSIEYDLRRKMKQYMINGATMKQIDKELNKLIKKDLYDKLDTLVRTENNSMLNRTLEDIAEHNNMTYVFVTENDNKVCSVCKQYDGKRSNKDDLPVPPLHPFCRCYIVLLPNI